MGFLRRLLGAPPAVRGVTLNITIFARVRDAAALEVVGEAYRQENVALARPPGPDDLPPGMPPPPPGYFKATLVPEAANEYDRNAIAVYLWSGGAWAQAGYLRRETAAEYQLLFRHLAAVSGGTPPAIACDAALAEERGGTGVILYIGTPGECAVELATESVPSEHRWVGKAIVFTGQRSTTIHGVPVDRHAQVMLARWAGCELLPRLTKRTDALIVADPDELTGNLRRAKEYGVEVVQEPDFIEAVGISRDAIGRVSGRWARG